MGNEFNITDICPTGAVLELKRLPGVRLQLRPFNLDDEIWLDSTYGANIAQIFERASMKEIAEICYHQLDTESRAHFVAREVRVVNEQGDEGTVRVGGAVLFRHHVEGWAEKKTIMESLLQTLGMSRPVIEKLERAQVGVSGSAEKKTKPTGPKSSTASQARTAGPSPKSGR